MKRTLLTPFEELPYFTLTAVKQLLGDDSQSQGTLPTLLYRWMKAGHIIQLKKGVYMSNRFFERHRGEADFSPAISAILLPQSYVSLEFMLQRYAVLSEVTYPVSAVTQKNSRLIENQLGSFSYRHIKGSLYHGFLISDYWGIPLAKASAAKALFDTLYLRPAVPDLRSPHYDLVEDLRLNLEDFSSGDRKEFAAYVTASQSPKMVQILTNIRRTVWRP